MNNFQPGDILLMHDGAEQYHDGYHLVTKKSYTTAIIDLKCNDTWCWYRPEAFHTLYTSSMRENLTREEAIYTWLRNLFRRNRR